MTFTTLQKRREKFPATSRIILLMKFIKFDFFLHISHVYIKNEYSYFRQNLYLNWITYDLID